MVQGGTPESPVEIAKAPGAKCARCWTFRETVGGDREHPSLCRRCVDVIKGVR